MGDVLHVHETAIAGGVKGSVEGDAANHAPGDFQPRELGVIQITGGRLFGKHALPDADALPHLWERELHDKAQAPGEGIVNTALEVGG